MLVTLIPLFDESMTVSAYSLFTQKKNYFLNPSFLGTGQFDGAAHVDGLEVIKSMGMDTISDDKEVLCRWATFPCFRIFPNSAMRRTRELCCW